MAAGLKEEISRLKVKLAELATAVEGQLVNAIQAISARDSSLAGQVIEKDSEIDRREVELEEECLKVLALHQPVAVDLRVIVAILKMNNDLERIGDFSANIADRAKDLAGLPNYEFPAVLTDMTKKAREMLSNSVQALVRMDVSLAQHVIRSDDEVDKIHRGMYDRTYKTIRHDVEMVQPAIELLSISRYLERIGDLSTNIAEDVIYIVQGRIVRHRT